MKKVIVFLILILPIISFSQKTFTFKSGGRVLQDNIKISPTAVRDQFNSNKQISDLYNAGRTKKTVGNVLLYGGIGTLVIKFISDINAPIDHSYPNQNTQVKQTSNVLYGVAAGVILVSIPIKIGFQKKIKKAILLMNDEVQKPKTAFIEKATFISNSNGFGISITF